MHPPRHMVESWIELLDWYEELSNLLKKKREDLQEISVGKPKLVSSSNNSIDSMINRGFDVVNEPSIDFLLETLNHNDFDQGVACTKSSGKIISRSKFVSQGEQLFEALMKYDKSLKSLGVVASCRMILWERSAMIFTTKLNDTDKQTSLAEAKVLLRTFESTSDSQEVNSLLHRIYAQNYIPIERQVRKSEEVEKEASNILNSLNHLVEVEPDAIKNYADLLKSIKTKIKASNDSLRIDGSIENSINERMKDILWLMNVSKYPCLLQPDSITLTQDSVSPPSIKEGTSENSSCQISWQSLVMICDKIPKKNVVHKPLVEGLDNIIHQVGSSLTKLKSVGEEWDTKVQKKLCLSARGLKRRRRMIPDAEGKEDDNWTVTIKELKELAHHKILHYVSS